MATSNLKPTDPEYARWVDPATGEYRVIEPGQTFKSVTDKITRIVLTPHTPMGWFAIFAIAGAGATHAAGGGDLAVSEGRGHLGASPSRWRGASPSSTSCGGSASATPAR